MDIQQLRELIARTNEAGEADAASEGMVYQVWEDGSVTLQKSGSLLWKRGLHCIERGIPVGVEVEYFPPKNVENGHAYAFCHTKDDADEVRKAIGRLVADRILFLSGNR